MFRALEAARKQLLTWKITDRTMVMVLYAMLEDGMSYMDAVNAYAQHCCTSPEAILLEMDTVCTMAGLSCGPYTVIRWCYREAINEN